MQKRTDWIWVCVDGVRGVAHRVDVLPRASDIDAPEDNVLPLGVERETAIDRARLLAEWWARSRLFSWWAPTIDGKEVHLLHKAYLMEEGSSGTILRDSVSGAEITV